MTESNELSEDLTPLLFQLAYALDTLAIALTDNNHVWTDEQRNAYESAMSCIQMYRRRN